MRNEDELANRLVLMVDDDPSVGQACTRVLRREPYQIVRAVSGVEALSILRAEPIEVIVCDEQMPGMRGLELLVRVKKHFPYVARIMLTGHASVELAKSAINEVGLECLLTKPCKASELAIAIRAALLRSPQADSSRSEAVFREIVSMQSSYIEHLERDYPGISKVERDVDGTILGKEE